MSDSTGLTAEEVADLLPGDNVLVHGLVSRPALNGRLGMVTGTFEAASGRLPVQVEHEPGPIALKPSNLEPSALPEGCRYFIGPAQPAEKSQPKLAKERSPKPKPKRAANSEAPAGKRRKERPREDGAEKPARKASKPKVEEPRSEASSVEESDADDESESDEEEEEERAPKGPAAKKAARPAARKPASKKAKLSSKRKAVSSDEEDEEDSDEEEDGAKTPEYGVEATAANMQAAVEEIVRTSDLAVLTARAVREKLEVRLQLRPGSLAPRKEEVGRMIDEALRVVRSAAG
jgi:hypothetical protein